MNSELRIRTPEGITFAYALAGPVARSVAVGVDIFCVSVISGVLRKIAGLAGSFSEDFSAGILAVAFFAVSVGYGVAFEWGFRGQTVGKRLLRLRVMDAGGLRLQFHQVLMRNLLRVVDMLPAFYLLGGVVALLSARTQRLGDLAAGTIVVRLASRREPDLDQLLAGKFNSLREHPHLAARLRQRATPEEARLILQALVRRDQFVPAARVALFAELAGHFKSLVAFPPETLEALPDEQFIRNVVDVLFRPASSPLVAAKSAELQNVGHSPQNCL